MKNTPRKQLELPDPAGRIWRYLRAALRGEITKRIPDFRQWALTGGTVLAAQWKHRESTDIDLKVPPRTGLVQLNPKYDATFDEAMKRLGGGTPRHSDRQIVIPLFGSKVDLFEGAPSPTRGHTLVEVDGIPEIVLSNTQILCGKLMGRGLGSPTRDLFDIAIAAQTDPVSLEAAVNCIPEDTWRETIARWHESREYHADEAEHVLKNVGEQWTHVASDPAMFALERSSEARYETVIIRWRNNVLEATTKCPGKEPRSRSIDATSREATINDLERHGLNGYLEHATGNAKRILDRIEKERNREGNRVIYATMAAASHGLPAGVHIDHKQEQSDRKTSHQNPTPPKAPGSAKDALRQHLQNQAPPEHKHSR